ncbi:MAG: PEP-CTERM sorting domain-containing protein [Gemmataceae bacterium]|nr:PEP-CTERM sorting domain-containing protein [Gemmata sp.]MDW8198549.1 PEP-CTERM sorting domain-containing protein [Gemmataceae bacterium]
MGIELFIPANWANLNQNVPGAEGRLASFWATAVNAGNMISWFPIIEFNNQLNSGAGGFRIWNNGSWINVPGFVGYNQWYDWGVELSGGNFNYYVNGNFVGSTSASTSVALSNVILQGYNAGNTYDIYWDNLRDTAVIPEPTTWAVLGIVGLSVFGYRVRRRGGVRKILESRQKTLG